MYFYPKAKCQISDTVNFREFPSFAKEELCDGIEELENATWSMKSSIEDFNVDILNDLNLQAVLPDAIPLASNPKWANSSSSEVFNSNSSMAFASKVLLKAIGIPSLSVIDITNLMNKKGYSKNAVFFMDNLIAFYSSYEHKFLGTLPLRAYKDTRIKSVEEILDCLKFGCPVPIRVNKSVYLQTPFKKGSIDITLFGFNKGKAIVVDSNSNSTAGIIKIPVNQLFSAIIQCEHGACAWNALTLKTNNDYRSDWLWKQ